MNFRGDYFIFVIFSIFQTITSQDEEIDFDTFSPCPNAPKNCETVDATIYFNGCTTGNYNYISTICSYKDGFPTNVLSLTFQVGGQVTFANDEYTCMSGTDKHDCICTFQHACLSQLMDQETFFCFLCCTVTTDKNFECCVTEFGMDQQLKDCMNGETNIDPKQIALDNANYVLESGVNLENDMQPFTFIDQTYDFCTSNMAFFWWVQSICSMLTTDEFNQLDNCQKAFANGD